MCKVIFLDIALRIIAAHTNCSRWSDVLIAVTVWAPISWPVANANRFFFNPFEIDFFESHQLRSSACALFRLRIATLSVRSV